jgi:hypothetical protein
MAAINKQQMIDANRKKENMVNSLVRGSVVVNVHNQPRFLSTDRNLVIPGGKLGLIGPNTKIIDMPGNILGQPDFKRIVTSENMSPNTLYKKSPRMENDFQLKFAHSNTRRASINEPVRAVKVDSDLGHKKESKFMMRGEKTSVTSELSPFLSNKNMPNQNSLDHVQIS